MWQRSWFFRMESLQITPGERRIILGLILINLVLSGFTFFYPGRTVYDTSYYEPVIEEFERLSGIREKERAELLARYYPPEAHPGETPPFYQGFTSNILTESALKEHRFVRDVPVIQTSGDTSDDIKNSGKPEKAQTAPANDNDGEEQSRVNICYADQAELETLPGIGPVTAERIIAYREKNGLFEKREDLLNVSGIGPVTLDNIRELIKVEKKDSDE